MVRLYLKCSLRQDLGEDTVLAVDPRKYWGKEEEEDKEEKEEGERITIQKGNIKGTVVSGGGLFPAGCPC